ncbi:MAG: ABC transporter substrate-binding protein [Terrimicrobiaceae bacterium]|nr:ABC transporter substrate-binding protein [Terrimicrobiaceae bacterium]
MKAVPALLAVVSLFLSISASAQVRVGAVYSTSGPQAVLDQPSWRGARTVVEQVNRGGGIGGKPVELILLPVDSTPAGAAAAVREGLKKYPDIVAFVGLSDTDLAVAAGREAVAAGRPFVTPGATSPRLPTEVGRSVGRDRFFLACFGDNAQAAAAADWLVRAKRAESVAIFYDRTATYPRLLDRYFTSAFRRLGGVVTRRIGFRPGTVTLIPPAALKADAAYVAATSIEEALPIIRSLHSMGFTGPIMGGDSFDVPWMWKDNPAGHNVFYTAHAFPAKAPGSASRRDVRAFEKMHARLYPGEKPDAFTGLGRDATLLLLTALARGDADAAKTVQALRAADPLAGLTGRIAYAHGSRVPEKPVAIISAAKPTEDLLQVVPPRVPKP